MINITCNMGRRDLPDMYALSPRALGIHIRQIPPAHVTTCTYVCGCTCLLRCNLLDVSSITHTGVFSSGLDSMICLLISHAFSFVYNY